MHASSVEQHAQQLREVIEHGEQAARRQLMAIEAEHQQTTALLETHRNILLGAFAAQFIFMLAFIVIIVRFRLVARLRSRNAQAHFLPAAAR